MYSYYSVAHPLIMKWWWWRTCSAVCMLCAWYPIVVGFVVLCASYLVVVFVVLCGWYQVLLGFFSSPNPWK